MRRRPRVKSIVDQGIKQAQKGKKAGLSEKDKELQSVLGAHRTTIKIIGTGGAGNNTLTRMVEVGIKGVEILAINTDAQDLLYTTADTKILIGKNITNGLGAGSNPQIGEDSARENEEEIKEALKDADMVFVTCGLGGGTGTGSAPIVAEIAKSLGALTISVVTLPFSEEGVMRWENAQYGLEKLQKNSDTVIVIQNDKLLQIAPELPLGAAFKVADEVLVNAVKGITDLVTEKGLVNLDFADVRAIMKNGGTAMVGIGESNSENRALDAIHNAISNPLLDVNITGATSALLNITGGASMSLRDTKVVMKELSEKLDKSAKVIWGARYDEKQEDNIRILLIVTGLKNNPDLLKSVNPFSTEMDAESPSPTPDESDETENFHPGDIYTIENEIAATITDILPSDSESLPAEDSSQVEISENSDLTEASTLTEPTEDETAEPVQLLEPTTKIAEEEEAEQEQVENNEVDESEEETLFDIREVKPEETQKGEKTANRGNKRVFTEIFEEEAQGDLNILLDCIINLDSGNTDLKILKDIKTACNSLKNTAQLFTFDNIEKFTEQIADFMDYLIAEKIFPTKFLKQIMEDIPDIINDLMYDDSEAHQQADEIQAKIDKFKNTSSDQRQRDTANGTNNSKPGESKKKIKNVFSLNKVKLEPENTVGSSKIDEAMQHVKKIFG